jgi:hypothetical protein
VSRGIRSPSVIGCVFAVAAVLLGGGTAAAEDGAVGLFALRVTMDEDGSHRSPHFELDLETESATARVRFAGGRDIEVLTSIAGPLARNAVFLTELPAGEYELEYIYLAACVPSVFSDDCRQTEVIDVSEVPEIVIAAGEVTYLGAIVSQGASVAGARPWSIESSPSDRAFEGWIDEAAPELAAYKVAPVRHWDGELEGTFASLSRLALGPRLNRTTDREALPGGGSIAGNAHGYVYRYQPSGEWSVVRADPAFGILSLLVEGDQHWIATAAMGRNWVTLDAGESWERIDLGVGDATVFDLAPTADGGQVLLTASGLEVDLIYGDRSGMHSVASLSAAPPDADPVLLGYRQWRPTFIAEDGIVADWVPVILSARHGAFVNLDGRTVTPFVFPGNVLDVWVDGDDIHCRCRGSRFFNHWMSADRGATWSKPD